MRGQLSLCLQTNGENFINEGLSGRKGLGRNYSQEIAHDANDIGIIDVTNGHAMIASTRRIGNYFFRDWFDLWGSEGGRGG
jgi:hypothetical protein